jgi:CheY-like chemotaxis protein
MARLLIVDDEKNIRQSLGRFLESCKHETHTAENGRAALAAVAEGPPYDLVLSDWKMAEMNVACPPKTQPKMK